MPHIFFVTTPFQSLHNCQQWCWLTINQIPFKHANAHISTKPFLPLSTATEAKDIHVRQSYTKSPIVQIKKNRPFKMRIKLMYYIPDMNIMSYVKIPQ